MAMTDRCIVLADKCQNILEGLRGLLETLCVNVVMVADQLSLFEALTRIKPKLAVVDLSLFDRPQSILTGRLCRQFPDVAFIILSDYDEPEIVNEVMSAGAMGYVLKQHAATDLFDAIHAVQKEKPFISPSIKGQE